MSTLPAATENNLVARADATPIDHGVPAMIPATDGMASPAILLYPPPRLTGTAGMSRKKITALMKGVPSLA